MKKECEMPTVFVGMELWSETYGIGFPFTEVIFRPSTGTIEAWVSDKCSSDAELTKAVDGWLVDGFVITGELHERFENR